MNPRSSNFRRPQIRQAFIRAPFRCQPGNIPAKADVWRFDFHVELTLYRVGAFDGLLKPARNKRLARSWLEGQLGRGGNFSF